MKANFKDRPYAVTPKRETDQWFIFASLVTCIAGGLLYLNKDKLAITFDSSVSKVVHFLKKPGQEKSTQENEDTAQNSHPKRQAQPAAIRPEDVTSPMLEQWEREDRGKQQKRQTVFNDDNYIPRGADNIISAVSPKRTTTYSQQKPQKRSFSNTHWQYWRWESYGSGFTTKTKSGRFSYVETERGIDTNSVCANYKRGSFDYRDCRKAAKQWFKSQCSSSFKQACLAKNMIP